MEVIVDGQSNFRLEGEAKDLLSVIGAVTEYLSEQGRAMVTLRIDGEEVWPEEVLEQMTARPLAEVSRIEVESEAIKALVETALAELQETLPELPSACRELAQVFHGSTPEEGYDPFNELAAIWSAVKQQQLLAANALGLDISEIELGGKTLHELHEELNAHLEECAQALKDNDCILIGDLLEYELAPRAEQEEKIVAILRERNAAQAE